ncbi:MAG: NAD-dependent epimerase/dehydratase family protein [Thermodesulfobacteriota bacterium]
MNILITGGAGFIGSHLVDNLLEEGYRVICLDNFDDFYSPKQKRRNLSRAIKSANFRLVIGDLREKQKLEEIFAGEKIEQVVHLAARAGVRPSLRDPLLYAEVNVRGTLNLLETCREFGVKKFIFASSSSVYGNNPKTPFAEDDRVDNPISPYAATKKAGELICYTYHHLYDFDIACLRYFTVYGPRQRPEMAIHYFSRLIYEGKKIPIFGDGNSRRDYTYIGDALQATMAALKREHGYEIYNIGESRTVSLIELVRYLEERLGKKSTLEFLPPQPGDVAVTFADIRKAQQMLHYSPQTQIEEGLDRFVNWFLEIKNCP